MIGPELRDQLRRVLRRINCERLRNDQQGTCKLGNRELLSGTLDAQIWLG